MHVCVKDAYQNSTTNMKVSIFDEHDISLICTKFVHCPIILCLSDASLIIADNCIKCFGPDSPASLVSSLLPASNASNTSHLDPGSDSQSRSNSVK